MICTWKKKKRKLIHREKSIHYKLKDSQIIFCSSSGLKKFLLNIQSVSLVCCRVLPFESTQQSDGNVADDKWHTWLICISRRHIINQGLPGGQENERGWILVHIQVGHIITNLIGNWSCNFALQWFQKSTLIYMFHSWNGQLIWSAGAFLW